MDFIDSKETKSEIVIGMTANGFQSSVKALNSFDLGVVDLSTDLRIPNREIYEQSFLLRGKEPSLHIVAYVKHATDMAVLDIPEEFKEGVLTEEAKQILAADDRDHLRKVCGDQYYSSAQPTGYFLLEASGTL